MNWHAPKSIIIAIAIILAGASFVHADDDETTDRNAVNGKGFAVVELFTSQGCSSCPPADQLLAAVADLGARNGLQVICLSFHVDYWNRLGWNDPYSNPRYSDRQRSYATALGTRRIYTPQMVVNGTTEFVGSQRADANVAISQALRQKPTAQITLRIEPNRTNETVVVHYKVTGNTEGHVLNMALTHTPPPNEVPKGENAGRTLSHVNVVRSFKTVTLSQPIGTIILDVPDECDPVSAGICAYVQHEKTKAISGAIMQSLAFNAKGS